MRWQLAVHAGTALVVRLPQMGSELLALDGVLSTVFEKCGLAVANRSDLGENQCAFVAKSFLALINSPND
jgi:hypothetical protein